MSAISSRHHPIVDAFRELAATPDPAGRRLLLDGVHLIRDAHDAGLDIELAVLGAGLAQDTEETALAAMLKRVGVEVRHASTNVLNAISPVRTPSGLVAIARRDSVSLDNLVTAHEPLLLVAVDVQDPGNVGALVRAAEAAGASGVVCCGASASPFGWKALRGSMGSALRMQIVAGLEAGATLARLREAHIHIVAAVPRGGVDPDEVNWRGSVAAVIGGEGPGLAASLAAASDALTTIPMAPRVESLNVAVAGALLLYSARRQRQVVVAR